METIKMGPVGYKNHPNKTEWDEKGHNVISHIIVSYEEGGVRSIQFLYVNNGALSMSKTYGSSEAGSSRRIVKLKHESEFVTGLSVEIFYNNITSLTFHTNQRKHEVVHLTFDSEYIKPVKRELHSGILDRSEFGGFFGTYGNYYLISIGFYVKLGLPDVKMVK